MFKFKTTSLILVFAIVLSMLPFTEVSHAADTTELRNIISTHGRVGFNPFFKASDACDALWAALPDETEQRIRLCRYSSSVSGRDVFFQFDTYAPSDMASYVYEIDVYPVGLPNAQGYKCSLFNTFDSSGGINPLVIDGSSLFYNGERLMTVECGKWTKFSVIVDTQSLTFDIYADRTLVKQNLTISKNITPHTIRVGINAGYMYTEMYFDNIRLYEGDSFRDIPLYLSNAEDIEDVSAIVGDSAVFMTQKDNVYLNGTKTTYTDLNYGKVFENDTLYVSTDAASYAFGCTKSELEAYVQIKNGTDFVPLSKEVAAAFGKYFYYDKRGWICISSSDLNLVNNSVSSVSGEASDIIDRFMQFDRPSGDELLCALKSNAYKQHPRIWITEDKVRRLRYDIQTNSFKKEAAEATITMADQLLEKDPVAYEIPDGIRLFLSCLEVRNRIMTLSAAYLISDESVRDKYADKIWQEVENACSWKDWNVTSHYLDSGKIGPGIALAYDVCYDYFTDEQKAFIRKNLCEKYLYYAAASYAGSTANHSIGKASDNWGAVCNGSVLMVCLATMDEEDESSEYSLLTKYLAAEALQGMEYSIGSLYPNGAWAEGLGYFEYMVEYISWSANALRSSCGSDFGLISYPGVADMPLYALYIQTINNGYFNYGDGAGLDETSSVCPEIFLLASLLGRDDISSMWYDFKFNKLNTGLYSHRGARDMLFCSADAVDSDIEYDFPLNAKFGSVEIGVMKSGWGAGDSYAAAVGGSITSQFDKGGFIFDALGERWAIDLGRDDYNISGGYFGINGATIYRKRAEGHNTLVINPDEDAGQIFGASANIKSTFFGGFDSYMIYDLSKVYADDVTKAERGFRFGDNRQTLTVQDEFSLVDADSTVMWFMHTKADITVSDDGKSAILTQNGKSIKVEFVTSLTDWTVEAVAAEPLPTTPEREGQTANTGISKIRFTGIGNGDCYITAKLTPLVTNAVYEPIEYIPMSEWEQKLYKQQCSINITNANSLVVCEAFSCELNAPSGFKSAAVYIDDALIGEIADSVGKSFHTYNGCVLQALCPGSHNVTVKLRYPDYPEEIILTKSVKVYGSISSSNVIDFEELAPACYTNAAEAKSAIGWFETITSEINGKATVSISKDADPSHGNVYTVKLADGAGDILAGQSYAHIYARQNADKSFVNVTKKGKVIFEFDIKMRSFWGASLVVTPFSGAGHSHSGIALVSNNKIAGTNVPLKSGCNWYHVELIYDLDNLKIYGKFGDTKMPVIDFTWTSTPSQQYLTYFRLGARAYGTVDGESDYFSLDNIQTSYVDTPILGYNGVAVSEPEISVFDSSAAASFDAETRETITVTAIIAVYNGNKLEKTEIEKIDVSSGTGSYTTGAVELPKNYTSVRCFVWQSAGTLVPVNKL